MGMGMLGAMAGAGQAIEGVGKQMFHSSLEQDRQNFLIEKQRMLAIESENRQVARINQDRTDRLGRVEGAKNGLLNTAISGKYGESDAAVAEADVGNTDMPLTTEQRNAIEQSKGIDRSKLSNMRGIDAAAAMKAGEYDLATKLKTIDRQEEATEQTLALRRELADTNARLKERDIERKEKYTDWKTEGNTNVRSDRGGGSGSKSGGGSNSLAQEKWDVAKVEKFVKSQPQFYMLPNEMGDKKIKNEAAFGVLNTLTKRLGGDKATEVMQQALDNATADAAAGEGDFAKNYSQRLAAITKRLSGGK